MTQISSTTATIAAGATATAALTASNSAGVATCPALPAGEEIYDLMPPQSLAYPWWSLVAQALAAVAVFYLLWLFYRWLTQPVVKLRQPVRQSPQKQAFRAIERLKLSPVWEQRQLKEICETLAQILKSYARDAFAIGMGEPATTDELLNSLQSGKISGAVYGQIKDLLMVCDQIKYTGLEFHKKTQEELIEDLRQLISLEGWKK